MTIRARIEAITDQDGAALGRRIAQESEAVIQAKQKASAAAVALSAAQAAKDAADVELAEALAAQQALYDDLETLLSS